MKAVVLPRLVGRSVARDRNGNSRTSAAPVRVRLCASALNHRDVWVTLGQCPDPAAVHPGDQMEPGWWIKVGAEFPPMLSARRWGFIPPMTGAITRVFPRRPSGCWECPLGTFAEYICVPADHVFPKPAHLNWEQAAAIPLAGLTAWRALMTQGAVQSGDTVLSRALAAGWRPLR